MQRIRINVRLLTILSITAIVILVSVIVVNRFQVWNQADDNLRRARDFVKQVETEEIPEKRYKLTGEALRAYQRYLESYPEKVDIVVEEAMFLVEQGKWFHENGDRADAQKLIGFSRYTLERALRRVPDRKDIRKKFVDTLFESGNYQTTIQHIRFLGNFPEDEAALRKLFDRYDLWDRAVAGGEISFGEGKNRDLSSFVSQDKKAIDQERLTDFLKNDFWMIVEDSELLGKLGRCYLGFNMNKAAIEALKKSVVLQTDNLDAYNALIRILRVQNRSEDAEYWLTEMLEKNPDMSRAYLISGQDRLFRVRSVRREKANEVLVNAEWDAMKASQKAVQRLIESADQLIPDAPITRTLNQDFDAVVDLAPASHEAVTVPYRDALVKVVNSVGPAVDLMKKKLSQKKKASKKSDILDNAMSLESIIEKDLEGCRDGLLLAVLCETQKSFLDIDNKNKKKHFQAARSLAKAILAIFPQDPQVYHTLASIEIQSGFPRRMIDWLIRGTQEAKEDPQLLWRLGAALAASGRTKEARDILDQLIAWNGEKLYVLHLEAILEVSKKNWSAAAAKLEAVRPQLIMDPTELRKIDILLAECYKNLGRLKDQRDSFARAASFDRKWNPALIGLAKSRAASGQLREAIKDYKVILELPNVEPVRYYEYAKIMLQYVLEQPKVARDYEMVEDAIEQAATAMPGALSVSFLEAEFLIAKGETEKARHLFTELHKQIHKSKQNVLQTRKNYIKEAKSLAGSKRIAKLNRAKVLLRSAQIYDTQESQVWAKLILLAAQQKDWKAADRALQEVTDKLGDTPTTRWLRAKKLVLELGRDSANALHGLAENTSSFDRTQELSLFRHLALLAIYINDLPQAEKLARIVVKEEPRDVDMQKILFHAASSKKEIKSMESVLSNLRKIEAKASAFWYYGEAYRLYLLSTESKNPKRINDAINLLSKASRMEPNWHSPALLLANIFLEQGKIGEAADLYMSAVRNGLQDPEVIQRIARLLIEQRRYKEADEIFDRLAQLRDDDLKGTDISASYVKAQLGDFSQSVDMARKACEDSKTYRDFLWLGYVLSVSSKQASGNNQNASSKEFYDEAEETFLKAIKLNKSAADAWMELIQFYTRFDKQEQANNAIEQAKKEISAEEIDLMLAQAYEIIGETKKAGIYYRKAIRNAPKSIKVAQIAALFFLRNNFSDESNMLLKRIVDKKVKANENQIAWAKRMLGMSMIREEGVGDITKTLKLIDENLKVNPNSILDLHAKARLLGNDPTGLHRAEAIELFKQIESLQSDPGAGILYELANLYHEVGRWNDYKATMRKVLHKAGDQPQFVKTYVVRLSEHGEYSEADAWLRKLQEIAPDDANTFLIECDLVFRQKRYDVFSNVLNDWVEKKDTRINSKKRLIVAAGVCQNYASKLRDQKKKIQAKNLESKAENFLLNYVKLEPKAELEMAVFYAKQSEFNKAISVLRRAIKKSSPNQFGFAAYRVLTEGGFSEDQITQIRRIIEQVSDAHPKEVFPKIILAVCDEKLKQPKRAESILREILREEPDNVNVLNHLAVLLAVNKRKLEEARKLIDKVIEIDGPKSDYLDSRAMVSLAQKHSKSAIRDLRRAIVKNPSEPSFYFHMAEALNQEGLRKPAMDALRKAEKKGLREKNLMPMERRNYRRLKMALQ